MRSGNNIHVFVSGGTFEDVQLHFGSLLQYIRDISLAKYTDANIEINRVLKNQSPTNMSFVFFGPNVPDITSFAEDTRLLVQLHHIE